MTAFDLPTYNPVHALTKVVSAKVYQVPNGMGTWGGGGHIFLEEKYVIRLTQWKIGKDGFVKFPKKTAKAIYILLHEEYHAADRTPYTYPGTELAANRWAAENFVEAAEMIVGDLLHTDYLWEALPDYWRNPTNI
jgi:hypothetical protein